MFYRNTETGAFGITHHEACRQTNASAPVTATEIGVFRGYAFTDHPTFNRMTHKLVEVAPINDAQQWEIVELSPAEKAQMLDSLVVGFIVATQFRLDNFAKTRNYDSILSACTYATSPTPKFAAEGQYAVEARDATWAMLYAIVGEIQAQTRPTPSSFADIEPLLPTLEWPA